MLSLAGVTESPDEEEQMRFYGKFEYIQRIQTDQCCEMCVVQPEVWANNVVSICRVRQSLRSSKYGTAKLVVE